MNLEELSTYDLEVQIKQVRYQMLGASGKEKARLTAKLLELMCIFRPKKQRYLEAMVKEDARLLLEYEPMQQWFREVFGEGYKIRGVYEPAANDVDGAEKGVPMSHEEANEHRANPFFRAGVNDSYSLNCQTCVVAYELRRRGYDVMAVPRDNYATGILANLVSLAWVDPITGTYPVRQVNAKVSNGKQAVKWFEGAVKQGERYLLTVNLDGGGGHVVILTRNEDGVLMVYDPQSGDRFLGEKEILDSFMRLVEVKYSMQEGFSPAILRVDNAQVNVPFIRKIIRRRHDP